MDDPHPLQVLVLVGAAVLALTALAGRLRTAPPVVLLLGGVVLALLPGWDGLELQPAVVLLLFLPALLYWESLTTSLREIRANLRVVVLSSVVLVLATAAAVAVIGHALGLSWPVAWVLGAVLSPTDATAVSAVARRMPRRTLTTLRAESLVNDGTALVVFAVAVDAATGRHPFGWGSALGAFALSYAVGVAAGAVTAVAATAVRVRAPDPLLSSGLSVLTPFAAYLLAEELHGSGVLAVVVAGLVLSQVDPRTVSARTRMLSQSFWRVATFLLNGALFVLVGLQVPDAVRGLVSTTATAAAWAVLAVSGAVVGTRLVWSNTVPYVIRALDRRPAQRLRRVGARHRLPAAWAGFRGGVSLAAALAVPETTAGGAPFPDRDVVVLVTAGVIVLTLLVQGLTLPAVLRWARLPPDDRLPREEHLAHRTAAEAGLAALPRTAAELGTPQHVVERLRADYADRIHELADQALEHAGAAGRDGAGGASGADHGPDHDRVAEADDRRALVRLRAALLAEKRAAVVRLRDSGQIDDIVLRRVQDRLDVEDVRLAPAVDVE